MTWARFMKSSERHPFIKQEQMLVMSADLHIIQNVNKAGMYYFEKIRFLSHIAQN